MSRWLTFFLLISFHCLTCSKAKSPCRGSRFRGATSNVHGVIGEDISLKCNVSENCTRGYWKYDNTIKATWLVPEAYNNDTYLLASNSLEGLNTLHIYNINESVEGFYTCSCDDRKGRRADHACFNLSVHVVHCPIVVQINGKKHVLDKCSLWDAEEMVDVKVNENITIKCDEKRNRRTNCSHIRKPFKFTVNSSYHLCHFWCSSKKEYVKSEVFSIILNVMDNTISDTTAMPETSISTGTTPKTITIAIRTFSPSFTDPSIATSPKTSTKIQNITFTGAQPDPESSTSPSVATQTLRKSSHVWNSNSSTGYTYLPRTATVNTNHGNTSPMSASWTTQDLKNSKGILHIIVASCVILVLAIIILILCVHITFFKIGIRSCNDKEEWVNPIYESADNGAQLPIVIPDGGNPYNTLNSPRQVADFSNAVSTTNNVHQINADLSSTNEIPMVQVESPRNVPVKLLDYTVTASNVGSMKLTKPRCKKIEKSPAKTETISLPKADDISPPPSSPHLYEMVNDSVRS
ncbi:hypothetical protein HOLleu_24657 [Holothuria leucospilota]|uniref:Ig-like domain-containing protein n=1 Tax=Holothuria leucospilota TaxID=206669 RepID=A0A9Q1BRV6_HOLLE|nr:hypothetical protein HOLleu_24657 [Holothuria leucospilota]